ncbi:unnamed protein product [Caenorhabditis angaria]|uniref:Serine/threonine-protein kinase TOR n=1 Tax=Caenorhabditis angaria TaxID=860376 RepID=A0A9P1I4R8_9PELO|nr:unnamed protein product [Caenorhabditis angaria]
MFFQYADVTTHVLNAISELSVIGGAELVKNINPLFSKLTQMINDSGNLHRREAALRAIGGICRSTAYVVDPYKDFPTLLDDLLKLLKTVMSSSIRRECIKTLGILGAIDPYTHKVFTGSVQSAYAISTALALPISLSDASDPRQDIIQWVNYEKCTLDEFYPAITIANLMMMMQNEDSQSYPEIAQAIVTIFRSLGDAAPQYVEQVVPRLIEVCRTINSRTNQAFLRDFFLRQLSKFVEIIKQHALPYMPDIFSIIADAWKEDVAVKMCVVSVLEEMGTALGADFSAYTGELIPYLLNVLHTDKTKERYLTIKVLEVMRPLCSCLVQHLHLVLPPVLIILDDVSIALKVRITALETILHMAKNVDISAYAPRMMQSWHHCIGTFELREKLLLLLIEIIKKLGKHFDVFARSVEIKLREHGLDRSDNFDHYKKLSQRAQMSRDIITTSLFGAQNQNGGQNGNGVGFGGGAIFLGNVGLHERLMNGSLESAGSGTEVKEDYYTDEHPVGDSRVPTAARSTMDIPDVVITKQRVNHEMFNAAWRNENLTSKDEWMQWLYKLRIAFLKCGSSPSLRAASSLADQYPHLARDLFPAVFMSIWTEVGSKGQDDLALAMRRALDTGYSDVIQTVLNLAEFMDHSEKGPLPIDYNILGKCAEKTKAYAKACRYKENEIINRWDLVKEEFAAEKKKRVEKGLERPANLPKIEDVNVLRPDDCQALITFANKLNVQEEAAGVVRYAESHNMNINMPGRWYEKLNEWEKALHAYEVDTSNEDTTMHEMRCLEALAKWEQLNEKAKLAKENAAGRQMEHKVAVIAARGAWAVDDWPSMAGYVSHISENTQDGAMLRAIVAVHNNEFPKAMGLIEKVRDMFDSELTAMASESYERAYTPMVFVQQMAELEEAIEFKLRPERRPRIALLWSRRLQGCRQNVEQWQRLLMLRSLVLTPQEMHPLRVKFASLCRKQGKTAMSREVLRELLNLAPGTSLLEAKVPQEKPQLVLALCKQLWQDEHREEALRTLEHLAKQFQKIHRNIEEQEKLYLHSQEAARICAKVFLKLGEWNEIHYKNRPPHEISGILIQNTMHRNNDAQKTINYYRTATQYDPKWHKAWHKLASSYFYATMKDAPRQSQIRRLGPPMGPPPPPNLPLGGFGAMNYPFNPIPQPDFPHPAPLGSLAGIPTMPSQTSPIMQHVSGFSGPLTNTNIENAMSAIFCFSKALFFAPGSRLEDTLRLLQLWFDYGHQEEVYGKLVENVTDLPITTWLEVVPQLMARLDSSDKEKPTQLIIKVLVEISKYKPQSLIYAVCVAARSTDANRQKNALSILEKMSDYHAELVKEAKMVTEELVRCAILWHEKWHDALDEASRVYFHRSLQDNNVKSMYEALKDLPKNVVQGTPKTMKEHSFNQTYQSDLLEAQRYCHAYECEHNIKDLNQAWEIYCQIFKRLRDQLVNLTLLDLNYVSPELVRARDLQLAVPGTYDPSSEPVGIASFSTKMTVITSKQRPRKMVIRGSNGLEYQFLLKGHEDPRQDERVMQLFGLVNTLLANNSETCRRNLTIQRYAIIALSKDSGLIGWVPNCDTLHSLVKEYREKKAKLSLSLEHKALQKMSADTEHLTVMQKLQCFESALAATKGDDLRQILWLKSPSSEVWFDRRTNYTRSVACMSMVGYILGLGDRHPSNLMLDRLTGKIVHIDFGDCFEVAMLREKFPERVPFRLTRMLINAMEITGLEGVYRYTAERVLKVLRTNQESLLAVLEAFVYDPVINWRLVEGMKRDPKVRKDPSRMNTNQAPSSSTTEGTMDTIKRKLAGTEFVNVPLSENPEPLPVTQQLERLIEQATCNMNLCQSYIGWCPFCMIRRSRIQQRPNISKAAKSAAPPAQNPVPAAPSEATPEEPTPEIAQLEVEVPEDPTPPQTQVFLAPKDPVSSPILTSPKEVHHVHFVTPVNAESDEITIIDEDEEENHRNQQQRSRSRNVSLCEDEAILQAKIHPIEKKRFTGKEELDTKSWKISDLARWNPRHEKAVFKRERRSSTSSTIITKSELNPDSQPSTPAINAPQVKIGADGKLVIDETSLVVSTMNNDSVWETVEEGRNASKINSMSFRNRIFRKSTPWVEKETELFYAVLRCTGTDFGLMHHYLPQRTRQELKAKYNREEKNNWHRIVENGKQTSTLDDSLPEKVQQVLKEIQEEEQEKKDKKEFEKEEERRIRQEAKELKQQEKTLEIQKRLEVRQLLMDAKAKVREAREAEKEKKMEKMKGIEDARKARDEAKQKLKEAKQIVAKK